MTAFRCHGCGLIFTEAHSCSPTAARRVRRYAAPPAGLYERALGEQSRTVVTAGWDAGAA